MSHSKSTQAKKEYSLYLEKWNPAAKKYILTCAVCGRRGYSPAIEEEDFPSLSPANQTIARELPKLLPKLELDSLGRCKECAGMQDRDTQNADAPLEKA